MRELAADFVWAACGDVVDAARDPVLRDLPRSTSSMDLTDADAIAAGSRLGRVVGGFPVLVEEEKSTPRRAGAVAPSLAPAGGVGSLRWPGIPLFFIGAYAALSVGPGAPMPAVGRCRLTQS